MAVDTNITIEILKIVQGLFGTILGGGLVLLGGWLTDRRKAKAESRLSAQREKALLTGMFAVRNYIIERINEWNTDGLLSRLEPLRTAQTYVHKLIDKAPGESEALMMSIFAVGLSLDALISAIDREKTRVTPQTLLQLAASITQYVEELSSNLEQLDIVSHGTLDYLSDEDVAEMIKNAPV